MKRLLIVSAFPLFLSCCGIAPDSNIRAYNNCLARHPDGAALCEGPRQAYEVEPAIFSGIMAQFPVKPNSGLIGQILPYMDG